MSKPSEPFRQGLLACDSWDSPLRTRYERAVQGLLVRDLTLVQKWSFRLISVTQVLVAALFVWIAVAQANLAPAIRGFFIEGAILCAVSTGYCILVLRRGVFHRQHQPVFLSGFTWILGVVISTSFLYAVGLTSDARLAVLFVGFGVMTLIGTGVGLLRTVVEQSELKMRERMLEIEYQLATITEKLGQLSRGNDP